MLFSVTINALYATFHNPTNSSYFDRLLGKHDNIDTMFPLMSYEFNISLVEGSHHGLREMTDYSWIGR